MKTFKIKIDNCSKGIYWYAPFVGQTVEAIRNDEGGFTAYLSRNVHLDLSAINVNGFVSGAIDAKDATIVETFQAPDLVCFELIYAIDYTKNRNNTYFVYAQDEAEARKVCEILLPGTHVKTAKLYADPFFEATA